MTNIGQYIKLFREERGLSQGKLAELSGMSKTSICDIELGKRDTVNLETVEIIAKALGIKMYELLGEEPPQTNVEDALKVIADQQKEINYLRAKASKVLHLLAPREQELLLALRERSEVEQLFWNYAVTGSQQIRAELEVLRPMSPDQLEALDILVRLFPRR